MPQAKSSFSGGKSAARKSSKSKSSKSISVLPSEADIAALEEAVGHRFSDKALLFEALTHASAETGARGRGHALRVNERLEFLGDRVLGLLTAEALLKAFPKSTEGDLAPRLNALVRKETCAEVARECGLGDLVVLAEAEILAGGREKPAILGDACEALMAAIYLDGGFDAALAFFERYWSERVLTLDAVPQDPKTRLQEWVQARWQVTPKYEVVERSGPDHAPVFAVEVIVPKLDPARGTGASKRQAEQAAATALWEREHASPPKKGSS